ncbi:hypothetical protein EDB81DRAFT_861696 [Dactylonectria macrodidyma]|uniref:Uncharacterized protein n=1 Tax=Dactylonectria macrodidyma TaxID=307937 RepID=A0A9P9DK42_9HYPO|nr:hypothetical protein EDB81DRAFT_861696 [Dactylonectria macrodidyma]
MTSEQSDPGVVDGLVFIEGMKTGFVQPMTRKTKKQIREEEQRRDSAPVSKLGTSVNDARWNQMKDQLTHLYRSRGSDEIRDISIYKRRFNDWHVVKNQGATRAARAKPKAPDLHANYQVLEDGEFDLHMHMCIELPDPLPFKRFEHHESVLKSVDDFIYGVFDSRNKGWKADIAGFLDADNNRSAASYHWRALSDQCHGVALLIRANLHAKAEMTLDNLLRSLTTVGDYKHPAFMVEFWRLCIRVQGAGGHIPKAKAMERLFAVMKQQQQEDNPVRRLVNSLSSVDGEDLRHVLRIGYVKAIRTMSVLIGDENVMVLDMLSFYCRFFSSRFVVKHNLLAKLQYVWWQTHDQHFGRGTANVAISYAYVYAAYYVLDEAYLAIGMARNLRDSLANALCRGGRLTWTLETEAFSFTSKTVASLHRQRARSTKDPYHYQKCCESMRSAIVKLEIGDRECRTRAAMLSKVLNRWLVEWERFDEAKEEALRTKRIEDSIPGKPCIKCARQKYCVACVRVIESGNERDEGCNDCWRPRSSLMCQRCAQRKESVGWKPSDKWVKVNRK